MPFYGTANGKMREWNVRRANSSKTKLWQLNSFNDSMYTIEIRNDINAQNKQQASEHQHFRVWTQHTNWLLRYESNFNVQIEGNCGKKRNCSS